MNKKVLVPLCASMGLLLGACTQNETDALSSGLTTFVATNPATRTSMATDGGGAFFWENDDQIWVKDKTDAWQKSVNKVEGGKTSTYNFQLAGSYDKTGSYTVHYTGKNSASADQVTIATAQTQTLPNTSTHLGESGDCGVGIAAAGNTTTNATFGFHLSHKATCLVFAPFVKGREAANYKLTKITVKSDNTIAGNYTLSAQGLAIKDNEQKEIVLSTPNNDNAGFPLSTDKKDLATNGAYMMIAPGKHSLSVIYHVVNATKNLEKDVTITINSYTYNGGTHYRVPGNLGDLGPNSDGDHVASIDGGDLVEVFDFTSYTNKYYMWDAAENYWSGHEWGSTDSWQPIEEGVQNDKYPKSKEADASRWFNEAEGVFEASNPLFKKLPNANEMVWYVMKGDPHWDNTTQWKAFGKTYIGGVWLKKLSVIAQENNEQLDDLKLKNHDGIDMRNTYKDYGVVPISGKPKNSEISKYFFLPALGYYTGGQLISPGFVGSYWSSSAYPNDSRYAYNLYISSNTVDVYSHDNRLHGFVVAQPRLFY